ncbi:MAG: M23 family metallopeptidase [Myxococcota bacterium]|nr:M23 family metallopeptidase [Myxococcota bacterium]
MGKRGFSIFFIPESGGISSVQLYLSYSMLISLSMISIAFFGGVVYLAWDLSQTTQTTALLEETLELGHQKREVERDIASLKRRTELLEMYALQAETFSASGPDRTEQMLQEHNSSLNIAISWPVEGEVSSEYGMRKLGIDRDFTAHNGLDIEAPLGSKIYAAADGIVEFSGEKEHYGKTIEILHGDGVKTLYAHASRLMVEKGMQVRKGYVIGLVGKSGRAKQPHLHFELRHKDTAIDPLLYLKKP